MYAGWLIFLERYEDCPTRRLPLYGTVQQGTIQLQCTRVRTQYVPRRLVLPYGCRSLYKLFEGCASPNYFKTEQSLAFNE